MVFEDNRTRVYVQSFVREIPKVINTRINERDVVPVSFYSRTPQPLSDTEARLPDETLAWIKDGFE